MGRMLEALQKLGTAQEAAETLRPLTAEELAVFGVSAVQTPPVAPLPASAAPVVETPPAVEPARTDLPTTAPVAPEAAPPAVTSVSVPEAPAPVAESETPMADYEARIRRGASEHRWADLAATASPLTRSEPESSAPQPRVAAAAPRRSQAEANRLSPYQELADRLLQQLPPARAAAVLFTRATETEDDAAVLAELAVTLARSSSGEMLMVDLDGQRPCVGPYLGSRSDVPLSDLLEGRLDWRDVVRRTKTARLSILSGEAGPSHQPPPVTHIQAFLDELRTHYDVVLLAAASAAHPEVGLWAAHCEASYLSVSLGQVTGRQLRQAAARLQRAGATLAGTLVLE